MTTKRATQQNKVTSDRSFQAFHHEDQKRFRTVINKHLSPFLAFKTFLNPHIWLLIRISNRFKSGLNPD